MKNRFLAAAVIALAATSASANEADNGAAKPSLASVDMDQTEGCMTG